jgi:hypothetical protein
MTYKLYRAKDTRDDSIKHLTAVGPCAITWSPEGDLLKHGTDVQLIESWN